MMSFFLFENAKGTGAEVGVCWYRTQVPQRCNNSTELDLSISIRHKNQKIQFKLVSLSTNSTNTVKVIARFQLRYESRKKDRV